MKYTVQRTKDGKPKGPKKVKDTDKANRMSGGGARRDSKMTAAEMKALGIKKGDHYEYK